MRFGISVCLLLILNASTYAAQCAAPPLNLPIRSLSVVPGTISHGIPVSIGVPPQQLVLTPSLQLDTSFIPRYTNSCIYTDYAKSPANNTTSNGQDATEACARLYGGGFDPTLSTTFFDNGTNSPVSEAWFKKIRFSDWHFMTDTFLFTDYVETYVQHNKALPRTPNLTTSFILPDETATFGGVGSSALGLTPDSRLLGALFAEKIVPSKSWSLTSENLCLGCVDEGAYIGDFQSFKPVERDTNEALPCILQVNVEVVDYHSDAGSVGVALLDSAFVACIDPGILSLVLPATAHKKLAEVLGEEGDMTLDSPASIKGASEKSGQFLRLKLGGGLQVDIEMPLVDGGGVNNEKPLLAINTGNFGAYGEGVPVLGKWFTDSVILRWDESTQEYGVARRNSEANGKSNLKPLGCGDFPVVDKPVETTPSVGIIMGSIVGGFVAGLLFAAAATFFYWRGQRGVESKYEAVRGEDAVSLRTVDTGGRTLDSRMSGPLSPPAPSLRESLRSHFSARSVSPIMGPYLVDDSQVYEAPEGETTSLSRVDTVDSRAFAYNYR